MKIKTAALALILVLAAAISLVYFKVKTIEFDKTSACFNENSQALTKLKNKNLIILSTGKEQETLAKSASCIKEVKIQKIYPSKLKLSVIFFQPVAKIDGSQFQVTGSGLVTEKTTDSLPTIFIPAKVELGLGKTIEDPQVLFALNITEELEKSDFIPANIRILDAGDVAVYSTTEAVALFSSQLDGNFQVDSLQSILAKAKIDAAKIEKVDLRFAKPVLVYK